MTRAEHKTPKTHLLVVQQRTRVVGSLQQLQQQEQGPTLCPLRHDFEFTATSSSVHSSKFHNMDADEAPQERIQITTEARRGNTLQLESKLNWNTFTRMHRGHRREFLAEKRCGLRWISSF